MLAGRKIECGILFSQQQEFIISAHGNMKVFLRVETCKLQRDHFCKLHADRCTERKSWKNSHCMVSTGKEEQAFMFYLRYFFTDYMLRVYAHFEIKKDFQKMHTVIICIGEVT